MVKDKILVLGGGLYARPFSKLGTCISHTGRNSAGDYDWDTIKFVVFTGGHDVDPSMYNEERHKSTYSSLDRDKEEQTFYDMCKHRKVPMVGICRGSQFLNVMNGGRLMQNVYNHAISGTHTITTEEGEEISVTSTHHQMMYPKGKFKLVAWASGLSHKYETGAGSIFPKVGQPFEEPEVVYFPDTKCLAVQYHPEYMNSDTRGYIYFQDLLKEYIDE